MSTQTNEPGADTQAATTDEARKAERARVNGILTCEEAKGREAMANHLAMNTDMSVDEAKAMLAVAPKADAKASAENAFEKAMANTPNPQVGSDAAAASASAEQDPVKQILSAQSAATGIKHTA